MTREQATPDIERLISDAVREDEAPLGLGSHESEKVWAVPTRCGRWLLRGVYVEAWVVAFTSEMAAVTAFLSASDIIGASPPVCVPLVDLLAYARDTKMAVLAPVPIVGVAFPESGARIPL